MIGINVTHGSVLTSGIDFSGTPDTLTTEDRLEDFGEFTIFKITLSNEFWKLGNCVAPGSRKSKLH